MGAYIEHIFNIVREIINFLGYWGIGGGMMLESACIPLPSEVVLPLGGFMAADGSVTLLGANIAANVGSMIGSFLAYIVGYYGGRPFILKYGKYFFVSEKHFYHAERTFNKYGVAAVFFGRLLPVVRTFISLPAGIAKMNLSKFLLYSLIGMIPWNFILIYLGYRFGQEYETIVRPIFHKFEYVVIGAFAVIILYFVYKQFSSNKKKEAV
ncbi:MAG: DedA family protein [Clostridia bacterium]|nr:DedA family protein [Clostridia bacterium]